MSAILDNDHDINQDRSKDFDEENEYDGETAMLLSDYKFMVDYLEKEKIIKQKYNDVIDDDGEDKEKEKLKKIYDDWIMNNPKTTIEEKIKIIKKIDKVEIDFVIKRYQGLRVEEMESITEVFGYFEDRPGMLLARLKEYDTTKLKILIILSKKSDSYLKEKCKTYKQKMTGKKKDLILRLVNCNLKTSFDNNKNNKNINTRIV